MERTTQLLLRNQDRIDATDILLLEPPRDTAAVELSSADRNVSLLTQDFAVWRWQSASGVTARLGQAGEQLTSFDCAIVYLPREKQRLKMMLHQLATAMAALAPSPCRLWLVGDNKAGIKSSGKLLKKYFSTVTKLDAARHCVLYTAREPLRTPPFKLDNYFHQWALNGPWGSLEMASLPGVFAHGHLDTGTAFLLDHLPAFSDGDQILDFGCGGGALGLAVAAQHSGVHLTMLDTSALAIESSHRSAQLNKLDVTLLHSDGFSEVTRKYDWILSNPPFHRGVETDYETSRKFCNEARRHLNPNGNIMLVANRHLPYANWLETTFDKVSVVAANRMFKVILARHPKSRH